MSIQALNPYFMFDGTAGAAVQLYERVLGAKVDGLMRYGDPPGGHIPPEHKDRVMHAKLTIGTGTIMVSDSMPGTPVAKEGNVEVALHFDDPADMAARFDALAAGGKVTSPIQDVFWGAKFGTLTDRFGIRWMFNCELKKETK